MTTATAKMTPAQRRTFDELLAAGMERPTMPTGLVEELTDIIATGTADAVSSWTESRLYVTKATVQTAVSCEGLLAAQRAEPPLTTMTPAVAIGNVSHQAILIAHVKPDHPVARYVDWSVDELLDSDDGFAQMWANAAPAKQANLRMQMVSRVSAFLDTFPPLAEQWNPKFEDPVVAKVDKLTLSARADLTLGRPKPDGQQTMLIVDFKTGALHDGHLDEGRFYALVSTLRHGIAPFRSTVLSLASGEWTDPTVDAPTLRAEARRVVGAVNRIVDVLGDRREPELTAGPWCRFCPAKDTCGTYAQAQEADAAA